MIRSRLLATGACVARTISPPPARTRASLASTTGVLTMSRRAADLSMLLTAGLLGMVVANCDRFAGAPFTVRAFFVVAAGGCLVLAAAIYKWGRR